MKLTIQRADPDLVRQVTILAAIIGSIVINTISNFFPPDGVDMATLSDRLFPLVQILPANGIRHLDTPLITVTAAVAAIFLILFSIEVAPKSFGNNY